MEINKPFKSLDFFINKAYWHHNSNSEDFTPIRKEALNNLIQVLTINNVKFYFDGETFQDLISNGEIKNIVYVDKLIINKRNRKSVLRNFKKHNFSIIKSENKEISILIKNRIIVIKFRKIPFILNFPYHSLSSDELNISYNFIQKIYLYRNIIFSKIFVTNKLKELFNINSKTKSISYKTLDLNEFLKLTVEGKDSINWSLRKPHLEIVTKSKKYIKVNKILNYLKKPGVLENLKKQIVEVDMSLPFEEPIHLNKKFWHSGNNFYFYPLIFGFKKNVIPYKSSNEYITKSLTPNLYSKKYYSKLAKMNNREILELFKKHPLEITNGHITSGRHRTFAMIGRLLNNEDYIPIYARIIKQ